MRLETYTVPSLATVIATGPLPTVIGLPETAPEAASITDTVPSSRLVTYTEAPSGEMAMPRGATPTGIVLVTVRLATSITDTEPPLPFVTYARAPSGENAIPAGALPTGMVSITVLSVALMTGTLSLLLLPTRTVLPSGDTATARGRARSGGGGARSIVLVSAFVPVLITETESEARLATYSVAPFGDSAADDDAAAGALPLSMVTLPTTVLATGSRT